MNVCYGLGICVFQTREALFNYDCIYNYLGDSGIKYVNFHNKKVIIIKREGCLLVLFGVRRGLHVEVFRRLGFKYSHWWKSGDSPFCL